MEEDRRLYLLSASNPHNNTSEEEFIRLVINVEAEKPSTDLFWFLFEVVSVIIKFEYIFYVHTLLYLFICNNNINQKLADDDTTPSETPKIDFFYVFFRILFEYGIFMIHLTSPNIKYSSAITFFELSITLIILHTIHSPHNPLL